MESKMWRIWILSGSGIFSPLSLQGRGGGKLIEDMKDFVIRVALGGNAAGFADQADQIFAARVDGNARRLEDFIFEQRAAHVVAAEAERDLSELQAFGEPA